MGKAPQCLARSQADRRKRGFREGPGRLRARGQAEPQRRQDQHAIDAVDRVEGAERVLKNRLHGAAIVLECGPWQAPDVLSVPCDGAGGGAQEPEEQTGERGFAAAALSDHGEDVRRGADGEVERGEGAFARAAEQGAAERDAGGFQFKRHGTAPRRRLRGCGSAAPRPCSAAQRSDSGAQRHSPARRSEGMAAGPGCP